MPVHGNAPFLDQAIQSVVAQDIPNWELLIVLDRPDEDLLRVARLYSRNDVRIRVLISPGIGIVDALNYGLIKAEGNLVARIDSDDCMEPSRLRVQQRHLEANSHIACVGSQMTLIDEAGKEFGQTGYPVTSTEIRKKLQFQNCIGHPSVMYQKDIVLKLGAYRKLFTGCEDYDLWLRLCKENDILNLEQKLTKYRISDFQYTKTFGSRHTLLEDASRLDFFFPSSFAKYDVLLSDEQLAKEIADIRKMNLFINPKKVKDSYNGLIVSKVLRVLSPNSRKTIKIIKVSFWLSILLLVSPRTLQFLIAKKIDSWRLKSDV